jgi:hypothetical protein
MEFALDPPYLIVKPFMSEEDFYREAGEDSDWEYLDGRLVMHSPASPAFWWSARTGGISWGDTAWKGRPTS